MKNQPLFLRLIAAALLLCCLFSTVGCGDEPDSSSLASNVTIINESTLREQYGIVSSDVSSEDTVSQVDYDTIPFTLGFTGGSELGPTLEFEAKLIKNISDLHSQITFGVAEKSFYFEELNNYVNSIDQDFLRKNRFCGLIYLLVVFRMYLKSIFSPGRSKG